jgi:RNA polymerase sigma-70 factor (ECF subfamily)
MDEIARLIEAEIPRLRRYARVLLRRRPDAADDLVQDTIVRGIEKMHLYEAGTNLRAWLFTVMHNQYVNSIRRATRQGHQMDVEKVHLAAPASQTSSLELRDLERAIDRLPDEQRITLLLIGLEGMKYDEVAQICNVPIGTVRSRLSRARDELRRMLEGESDALRLPPVGRGAKDRDQTAVWRLRALDLERTIDRCAEVSERSSLRRALADGDRLADDAERLPAPPRRRSRRPAAVVEE